MAKAKVKNVITEQIAETAFKTLVKRVEDLKKAAAERNGEAGALIGKAIDDKHLHRKAFSIYMQLKKMSPEKLAACLESFDYYRDVGGLDKIAESAPTFDEADNVVQLAEAAE